MRTRGVAAAGLLLGALATPALGCGACIEDQVAAVYDHDSVQGALQRDRHVAFFAIEGPMAGAAQARRAIRKALLVAPGTENASVRVSLEPAALSVTYDPKRIGSGRIAEVLNRELARRGMAVSILQVMEGVPGRIGGHAGR